ncbi:hypothetical protein BKA65DRAFT_498633 [Rhexocercosporidium sp. MPI-PUGE-AT-0058]|nr:hypothetical protein BKA65DRAFT_498633 [Rhexocercosporidium sp. MPI-PUGE-AT-0058]
MVLRTGRFWALLAPGVAPSKNHLVPRTTLVLRTFLPGTPWSPGASVTPLYVEHHHRYRPTQYKLADGGCHH